MPRSSSSRRVAVTGVGLVSPLGIGNAVNWEGLLAGRNGIGPITRFDPSADAVIAISRYQLGVPWHRSAAFQMLAGVPLPESVQFERCEVLANAVSPVFRQLEREAASADVLHEDDTPVRILALRAEITASPAIANGRIYIRGFKALYAISEGGK